MMSQPIKQILNRYTTHVEATIQGVLKEAPPFLHDTLSYHFGWLDEQFQPLPGGGGKMLRPTLNLLVYEALTDEFTSSLPVAATLEMVHNFSLLHDDVEDNGRERRGRATAWTLWGKPRTINMGDYLLSLSFKTLHQLDKKRFTPETIFAVFDIVTDACVALTSGQDFDMAFETQLDVSTEMYLDMISRKTGALIRASVMTGARLASIEATRLGHYQTFANNIGFAFQIQDDVLGLWGDAAQTGKSATDDLQNKKKTLPIIYMLGQLRGQQAETIRRYYQQSGPLSAAEMMVVREALATTKAQEYTTQMVNDYHERALEALQKVATSHEAHQCLEALTRFLINRTY